MISMAKKKAVEDEPVPDASVYVPNSKLIPVDELEPTVGNPNELKGEDFDRLVQEIKEVGFIDFPQVVPIVDGSYRIVGGEHRWRAAKALGMKSIPCVVLSDVRWQEADLQMFVTVRLNMLRGKTNPEKMVAIYKRMAEKYGEKALRGMFGYTETDAWRRLVKSVKQGLRAAGLPKSAQDKFEKNVEEATGAQDLSSILNHLMNQYGDTLEYSFMIFSFGGKEHLYVAMSKKTKKVMDRIVEVCRAWGLDMNEVVAEVSEKWLEAAEDRERDELNA